MRLHLRRTAVAALLLLTVLCALRPGEAQSTFEILKSFLDGSDGDDPMGPMVQAADGWIHGLTAGSQNGTHCATAFRFHPNDAAGTFTTI